MWWSRRSLLLALAASGLAGCGFRPLYAPPQAAAFDAELATVKVNPINDRFGQLLAITLRDNFNPSGTQVAPRYALSVALAVTRRDLGILPTGTASRGQIDISANFSLLDLKSNNVVYTGVARSTSGFNILNDDYATVVAQNDAQTRLLSDIADEIQTRVAVYLQYRPPRPGGSRGA